MNSLSMARVPSLEEAAVLSPQQIVDLIGALSGQVAQLTHQLEWFRRQIFGQKSERRVFAGHDGQMSLGEAFDQAPPGCEAVSQPVAAHTRRARQRPCEKGEEDLPFFDESRVPVEVIELCAPETEGLGPDEFELISHKESFRLAQRPGSYVVLKYRRPVIKLKASATIVCPPAPGGIIEGSRADVSFIAGLLVDKFAYHLPLYRQHKRLGDGGITVGRPWLTQIGQLAISLLEPIYEAQFASIRASRVKAMDETPIKAGRDAPGKLKAAYFWPVYGERDEVCFPFFESRRAEHIEQALGLTHAQRAVLLSDGYDSYTQYANKTGLTHAQCWAHARRKIFQAQQAGPQAAAIGLELIGKLYAVEAHIRDQPLAGANKRDYRLMHAKPIVDQFFAWIHAHFEAHGLAPPNVLTKAMAYARKRRLALEVFLTDPDVPIDTNHLERALREIPMGRKAWLFCWTELGAKQVGIMQSLIVTCRLHGIDPYEYLVDVLQRVGMHPADHVQELTPRLWKQHFAANPLRSPLHSCRS
jgi:transposase